jgi:hypothetical protein
MAGKFWDRKKGHKMAMNASKMNDKWGAHNDFKTVDR